MTTYKWIMAYWEVTPFTVANSKNAVPVYEPHCFPTVLNLEYLP